VPLHIIEMTESNGPGFDTAPAASRSKTVRYPFTAFGFAVKFHFAWLAVIQHADIGAYQAF